jgi:hypothetical protein
MPEEIIATTPTPAEGTTGTTDAIDISKYINNDGTFREGYKDALVPEELRTNKFYDIFHDIQGIMKAAGHQAVTLGKYGTTKGVLPINEKSSPYEVEAFRAAMGVPKDGAGYKYAPPEDISSEDLSPEFMKEVNESFNKAHYTQAQYDTAINLYTNHLRLIEKVVDEELSRQVSDAENRLRGEWGDMFDARTNLARAFITKMAGGWSPEKYNELFGEEVTIQNEDGTQETMRKGGINDAEFAPFRPLLLDLFATIEEKYGIVKSIQQQIEDIEATPGFMDGKLRGSMDSKDRAKYEELVKQRDALYKKMYPG